MWYKHFKGNVWRDFRLPMAIHTLFDKYLDHMLVKFEQIRMVRTIQNLELFDKNGKPFLWKCWRHFERRFCDWNNCLMLSYIDLKTIIFLVGSCLSSFVSLWIECGFLFEWYSFLYMQIISLLFNNMQISECEPEQQATACHFFTLQKLLILDST